MPRHSKRTPGSLIIGTALICPHIDGGWALPGGRHVWLKAQAEQAGETLDAMIRANGGAQVACRVRPLPARRTRR